MGKCLDDECYNRGKLKGTLCCLDCKEIENCKFVCKKTVYNTDPINRYKFERAMDCPTYEFYKGENYRTCKLKCIKDYKIIDILTDDMEFKKENIYTCVITDCWVRIYYENGKHTDPINARDLKDYFIIQQ